MKKYSPDQPRDEHGRFGEGDGESKKEPSITDKFQAQLSGNYEQSKEDYAKVPDTNGGQILNTDLARELSGDYRADRSRSADVHEPASAFVKQMYADKLKEPAQPGQINTVLFTAGGTGAGKSTALNAVPDVKNLAAHAQIIYDTNMNTYSSGKAKIDQALAAGKLVSIAYVYRDPMEALVNGALPRADRMGRTVPVEEHAKTHAGSFEVVQRLQAEYAGNHNVQFHVIDNSLGPGKAQRSSIDQIAAKRRAVSTEDLRNATRQRYADGKISRKTYEGFTGDRSAAKSVAGVERKAGRLNGGKSQSEREELDRVRRQPDRGRDDTDGRYGRGDDGASESLDSRRRYRDTVVQKATGQTAGALTAPIDEGAQTFLKNLSSRLYKMAIDAAAHEAATSPLNSRKEPSDRMKSAGNYRKGHITIGGLDIAIENPAGSRRRPQWPVLTMHYGYIKNSMSWDGEQLDVFVKPQTDDNYSGPVFVIAQTKADGSFDEFKAVIGFSSKKKAVAAYLENYTPGWKLGDVMMFTWEEFKQWVAKESATQSDAISRNS